MKTMEMEQNGKQLMEKYELGKFLGQGTFAKVYLARNLKTGQQVAVKIIDKEKVMSVGLMKQTKREISIMKLIKHPNVLQLYEVMATKTKIYFVMEYAKGGELFDKIKKGRLKEDAARRYFQQMISAVEFCHSKGVCHRDLKPENLLIDDNGVLKVSDFGLSALSDCKRQDGLLHTTCGTPAYVAPEVIIGKGYDGAKSDVWSCGVILFVLLTGHLPFHDANLLEMYKKIVTAEYTFPYWVSTEARRLINKILDPNPRTRISISKVKEHRWIRKGLNITDNKPVQMEIDEALTYRASNEFELESTKPTNLNAFDFISLSSGLSLSGLFALSDEEREAKFTSTQTTSAIMSELECMASSLCLRTRKKDGRMLEMEGFKEGSRYGRLRIEVEIFEFTSSFHLVEMKFKGEKMEFDEMLKEDIKPALKEVAMAWQG